MKPCAIPFDLPFCEIVSFVRTRDGIEIHSQMERLPGVCPQCKQLSKAVHGYYERTLLDLPVAQLRVRIRLRVRRYRCQVRSCEKQTFSQLLPGLMQPYQRATNRLLSSLYHIAQTVGGQAGARLAYKLAMPASGSTLLRIIRRHPEPDWPVPSVVGVDDWAFRKGHVYGTILVDLVRRRVVDLLQDRTAATLRIWLQTHAGVELVARDRSLEYALGISEGAPGAVQVADRWHLLKNLGEVTERALQELYPHLRSQLAEGQPHLSANGGSADVLRENFPRRQADEQARQERRLKRIRRYEFIRYLSANGLSQQRIASLLNISRGTVIRYARAETFPERESSGRRASILDPYLPYLESRFQAGCDNAHELWREIVEQGYPGAPSQVRKWMRWRRKQPVEPEPVTTTASTAVTLLPSAKELTRLLTRKIDALSDDDRRLRERLCTIPEIAMVEAIVCTFQTMVRDRQPDMLEEWLMQCRGSKIQTFMNFAESLEQDGVAVRAALATNWSNGQTEGQINRLKLLKRSMYGRANLDLLRRRVLYHA